MGVASGSGWNLWVWLLDVVVRRYSKTSLIWAAWVTGVPVTKNCPYVRIYIFIQFNIILLLYLSFRFIQRGRIICDLVCGNQPYAIKIDFELQAL